CSSVGRLTCLDQPLRSERIATRCATRTLISSIFSPLSFLIFVVSELKRVCLFVAHRFAAPTRSRRTSRRLHGWWRHRVHKTFHPQPPCAILISPTDSRRSLPPPSPSHQYQKRWWPPRSNQDRARRLRVK